MALNIPQRQSELQEAQQKKIDFFCYHINNNDLSKAEYYLTKANWDEKLAVEIYFNKKEIVKNNMQHGHPLKRHSSARTNANNIIINNKNKQEIYNLKVKNDSKYIEYNISYLVKKDYSKGIHSIHDKSILYIRNNLKNVETNFKSFSQKLKYNSGIIMLYEDESFSKVKEQIIKINNDIKKINQNYIIFPTSIYTEEGLNLRIGLSCVSYPSYIFCKYKDDNNILITDRMDGAFDITFFIDCVLKNMQIFDQNIINNKENKKVTVKKIPFPENNPQNEKYDKNNNVMKNMLQYFNRGKKGQDKNAHNHNNHNQNIQNKENLNKNMEQNPKNYEGQNKKEQNEPNSFNRINNIINNKKIVNQNNIIKKNEVKDNDNKIKNNKDIKIVNNNNVQKNKIDEQNYGDFFLGDSMEIPFLFGNYNNNNSNKKINEDKKDNNYDYLQDFNKNNQNDKKINQNNLPQDDAFLRDSIFQLSDGQVLAKREAEMRKLEKMQEEKEKKEEEERKKKLEEEKKIKEYENEAKMAKMLLGEEPDDNNPDVCFIKFRLPDGEKILERKFLKTDKISILYDYVKSNGREIFMEPDATDFDILCSGFPPQNLENKKNSTLEKEGLYPNSILQIREK